MKKARPEHYAEQHVRVPELAARWAVSERTIRRKFRDHPRVKRLGSARRVILVIPESVAREVYEQIV
jgi:hypothetical protein